MKTFRCPECGGVVRPSKATGKMHRYGTMMLELPKTIAVPTCAKCGEGWIDAKTGAMIDQSLEPIYRAELREKAQNAIGSLGAHVRQYKLETMLGLSVGYLSKIRNGEKDPSAHLVALLALLASDPKRRMGELEDVWGGDPTEAAQPRARPAKAASQHRKAS